MLIATLLLATSIAIPQPQPSVPAIKKGNVAEHTSEQKTGERQKQNPVEPRNVPCNCGPVQTQPSAETNEENPYNPTKDTLYRAYLIATIIGVVIALGGISVLFWQTRHIRTQSEHVAKQIDIQQRSSRQWMNVNQWEHQLADGLPNTIQIHFQIENPTPIPFIWT